MAMDKAIICLVKVTRTTSEISRTLSTKILNQLLPFGQLDRTAQAIADQETEARPKLVHRD
ncbi:hypothetical protein FRC04_003097 [Tulasnella sp. 424]|nr:hypothetical protein FRC04_003097 [Tulasnella sp. 424]KAG8981111.1 hypothetical protein FRC05_004011 [Tulasnella sp. 425]